MKTDVAEAFAVLADTPTTAIVRARQCQLLLTPTARKARVAQAPIQYA
jgi:hypothetical protein